MSPVGAAVRFDRFERAVLVGAAVVILAPAGLVASTLSLGLASTVQDAIRHQGSGCSDGMFVAMTPRRDIVCLGADDTVPRGWVVVAPGS